MPGRSRLSLDAPLSAVIVKLTSLVAEAGMKEYALSCGGDACSVVAGVSVDVVEVAVVVPCIEEAVVLL